MRSPVPHARIRALHLDKALGVPGVWRIFTAADVPGRDRFGLIQKDQPLLAEAEVRFVGEAVALVAAESERAAAAFVRSHFDAMPVRVHDAPREDEILVALVVTDSGRPHPRVGGLRKEEAKGEDGLR